MLSKNLDDDTSITLMMRLDRAPPMTRRGIGSSSVINR